MNKGEIIKKLGDNYEAFLQPILAMPRENFESAPKGKWTPGQQLEHLARSVRPLALALYLPEFPEKEV